MSNIPSWYYYYSTSNRLAQTYINGFLDTSGGLISRNGNLTLTNGDASLNRRLFVNGDASFGGNLTIMGNLSVQNASQTNIINTITTNVFSVSEDISLNGNIVVSGTATATSFNATSDYRIKENVIPLDASFTVDRLRPIYYQNARSQKSDIGFLAHEVQQEYPFLVNGEKDGMELQTLNYIGLIGVLVKEVKLLKEQMKELQNK
jgi:hypothetical protein